MGKKFLTAMLLASAVMLHCLPASAQEYTADGTASCRVSAVTGSSYFVQVPAVLELRYDDSSGKYEGSYEVAARGSILPEQSVTIRPMESSFALTGTLTGSTAQAYVSQTVTQWVHSDKPDRGDRAHIHAREYAKVQGSVSAKITEADSYTGEFTFEFFLGDYTE